VTERKLPLNDQGIRKGGKIKVGGEHRRLKNKGDVARYKDPRGEGLTGSVSAA